MDQYQVALVCPYCRVINKMDVYGKKRGFVKGSVAFTTTCVDCEKGFKTKPKDVVYLRI